jgi:hypothetical protein
VFEPPMPALTGTVLRWCICYLGTEHRQNTRQEKFDYVGCSIILSMWLDNSFGIVMGYELEGRFSISCRNERFFSTARWPDRLSDSPNIISIGYRGSFTAIKLPDLHLESRSRL